MVVKNVGPNCSGTDNLWKSGEAKWSLAASRTNSRKLEPWNHLVDGDLTKIHLWKSEYAALDVIIRSKAKSHKTLPQTTSERLNTDSVGVKVDASK